MAYNVPLTTSQQATVLADAKDMVKIAKHLKTIIGDLSNPTALIMKIGSITTALKNDPEIQRFFTEENLNRLNDSYGS